ncbi:MAG: SigB/SigF/SigG family RNA polymerase sigma factor [Micromonosporaceae bacterium]|nr:SigB/SigF/SigG family RNA polymerase sigma factor [Micromonosporaceae bacterium]
MSNERGPGGRAVPRRQPGVGQPTVAKPESFKSPKPVARKSAKPPLAPARPNARLPLARPGKARTDQEPRPATRRAGRRPVESTVDSGRPSLASSSNVDEGAAGLVVNLAGLPERDPERAQARESAIEAWLPLARHLAQRFQGRGEPVDDLAQIATIGLIKAIDRFDPGYGTDFTAYAVPTIVGEIKRHFRDRTWDVRVPRRLQELKLDISEATSSLAQQLGRSPTVPDIADYLQRSEEEVLEGLESARAYSAVSLQTLVGTDEDGTELGNLVGVTDTELELAEFRAALGPALEMLSPREQKIVLLRFFGNMTQTQIAERIGISQMHVSRLLTRSLATLRDQLMADL